MTVRRATALPITMPLYSASSPTTPATGLSFSAGEAQVSKDGAAFVNLANSISEIGATGIYTVILSASEMDASWVHVKIVKANVLPLHLQLGTYGGKTGSVVADGGNTSATFKTDMTESPDDYWKDALLVFTTGTLAGQVKKIADYVAATGFVTTATAFTGAPSAADRFSILNI